MNNCTVQYRRIGRTVKVQGVIETVNIASKQDVNCFTLPVGFRPTFTISTCLPVASAGGDYVPHFCTLGSNGTFSINDISGIASTVIYLEFTL